MKENLIKNKFLIPYEKMMTDTRKRIDYALALINNPNHLSSTFDIEATCLHVRKILENIALANLVANQDEYKKIRADFERNYHAERIIGVIEKINPDYYPQPIELIASTKSKNWKYLENFLTKQDFIKTYNNLGNILHSRNPFNSEKIEMSKVRDGLRKVLRNSIKQLRHHLVKLPDGTLIVCVINQDGSVQTTYWTSIPKIK